MAAVSGSIPLSSTTMDLSAPPTVCSEAQVELAALDAVDRCWFDHLISFTLRAVRKRTEPHKSRLRPVSLVR